jgi:hypothetical protein
MTSPGSMNRAPATVALLQHFNNFEKKPHCRADCLVCYSAHSTKWGLAMGIAGLTSTARTSLAAKTALIAVGAAAPSERNPIGWAGLALAAAGLAYLLWTNL